jgi:SAM-dependent methyltransferase
MYDPMVFRVNLPLGWRCSKARLLALYDEHVSARHLDVGVATGCLLDECHFPVSAPQITLMDVYTNPLDFASKRLARYAPIVHQADALEPWGLPAGAYDSIGLVNLLQCMPGALPEKAVAFEHARTALAPGGVVFGATILAHGVKHTRLSRRMLKTGNRRGAYCNLEDSLEDLEAGLARTFASHDIQIEGAVALFTARS